MNLESYVDELESVATISGQLKSLNVLELVRNVWHSLNQCCQAKGMLLTDPDACPGDNDNFMLTWSDGEHYLECEIFGTGAIEFFYQNRRTHQIWAEDTTLDQGFSDPLLEKIGLFWFVV